MPRIPDLPLFPLGLVLYPNERLPLHIFEPRYKEMIGLCLEEDRPFGIVLFQEGVLSQVGCTARVARVLQQYEDGRMDILVEGEERFHIIETLRERTYLMADVETYLEPTEPVVQDLRERVITQHMKLLELAGRSLQPTLYQDIEWLSFFIAHNAGLSIEQKQNVLELDSENERIAFLAQHLEAFIPRVEQAETFRRKVQSNGHFKDFPPEGL